MVRRFDENGGFDMNERSAALRAFERLEGRLERVEGEAAGYRRLIREMGRILQLAGSGSNPADVVRTIRALAERALRQEVKTRKRKQ